MLFNELGQAKALINVIGQSRWEAVIFAKAYEKLSNGEREEEVARWIYTHSKHTLTNSKRIVVQMNSTKTFLPLLAPRQKKGSAENAVTKLFPATITEQRFLEIMDNLCSVRGDLHYTDERETAHTLVDFRLHEGNSEIPINIKNAGTRFFASEKLVGLEPDDCLPIPAYKANAAIEKESNLLYVISPDYELLSKLETLLPTLLSQEESIVWDIINEHAGAMIKNAEDVFVFNTVRKYWKTICANIDHPPFYAISARKTIKILHTDPKRTPGIGLRAWGTGASAEVNVHVSINQDTTPWYTIDTSIREKGLESILEAVNRTRTETVYDPEI